jgi:hypothetical protein
LNLNSGGFFCFGCGAKGGDLVAFVQLRYGLDFKAAVSYLGAWGTGYNPHRSAKRLKHIKEQRANQELEQEAKRLRLASVKELRHLERLQEIVSRRLSELQQGAPEKWRNERELCWWILSDVLPRIRVGVAIHYILSFGSRADREQYVRHPEQRKSMIEKVLDTCYVRHDQGRYIEVQL